MEKKTCWLTGGLLGLLLAGVTLADPDPYLGADMSGRYLCTGHDLREGDYKATVTLLLNRAQSSGQNASYDLKMQVPGYGEYHGSAVGQGMHLAITFASNDPASKDHGTGLATITNMRRDAMSFTKFYYEPDYEGGDYGTETCTVSQ